MNIQQSIEDKVSNTFNPIHMQVINESHMHSVPENSQTHFNLLVVSENFEGKRQVARHQMIYKLLADELAGPVHALALHTYTHEEWQQTQGEIPASPNCQSANKT